MPTKTKAQLLSENERLRKRIATLGRVKPKPKRTRGLQDAKKLRAALSEAEQQQAATSEILSLISSSPADLSPVMTALAESAARLCEATDAHIWQREGDFLHAVASHGDVPIRRPHLRIGRDSVTGRAVLDCKLVHVRDLAAVWQKEFPNSKVMVDSGHRTVLAVPLVRKGSSIGAILIRRSDVRPFAPKQLALLKTFADQAVIAIENVRLFREIAEKGRQLEEASQHKSQFLASMSHELRTPLNAILGFNEMIIDQVYGEVPADVMAPLENIQTSGKHLLRLINNVLDLAKIEAGRMELALADYAVNDVVESVRATLQPLAAEKGLELAAMLPDDLPLAYGDFGRITQCLMNLAGNSLKFTKSGSVTVAVEQNGEILTYRVADTGIGIPPDKIDTLFTEFKQTDATIASEYGGTGLGLSITKQFIEMHGGRIWVESVLGQGSTFIFEIPLRVNQGAEA